MLKSKISKKQDFSWKNMPILSLKKGVLVTRHYAARNLRDRKVVSQALWECLKADDTEGFKEVLRTHLEIVNKEKFATETGIAKRTLFRILSPEGNPSLENISKIVHKLCA